MSDTLELESDEYPSDEDSSIVTNSDDEVFAPNTPIDKMLQEKSQEPDSDYYEGRTIYCDICFNMGFRTCTYPCRNKRDHALIPPWIFIKLPKDHVWFRTCIEAIHETEDRARYYNILMNKNHYSLYHPNGFKKVEHTDILNLGYIITHNGRQVSDRYWINKIENVRDIILDENLSTELCYIKEFRERIKLNNLD
jgi:hypothetical protein